MLLLELLFATKNVHTIKIYHQHYYYLSSIRVLYLCDIFIRNINHDNGVLCSVDLANSLAGVGNTRMVELDHIDALSQITRKMPGKCYLYYKMDFLKLLSELHK